MRSILVGLDGSDDCLPAINLGVKWAKRFDALLVGIGVVDEPAIRGFQPQGKVSATYQVAYDQLLSEHRHEVEQALERFAIRCSDEQISCKLLEDEGQPCERILMELQRYDLLVLGGKTHFRHARHQHPCQTLENVLRAASRPVVVATEPSATGERDGVVVAYDGSLEAARALQVFVATGLAVSGAIDIVTVHPNSSVEAARTADRAAEYLRFHDLKAERVPLVGNVTGRRFLSYAEEKHAELLVMGAFGQPRMKEFFFGSATCTALENSSTALFLYH